MARGHLYACKYPLGKLANEANIASLVDRREQAFRATVDQTVGGAVFSGSTKALNALKKLIRDLTNGD